MSTRESIIELADELIRGKGFNAFSFYDISKTLNIKNASVHYHFPTKTDLGVAVVKKHIADLDRLVISVSDKEPFTRLKAFLSIYSHTRTGNCICIVGSLASDLTTVDPRIAKQLKILVTKITGWLTETLEEGRVKKMFRFQADPATKALMIAGTMLASLQLIRVVGPKEFQAIKEAVIEEIKY